MSRNGSGTYTLPAGNPVVTGTTITSSWANTTMQNIADGLTQSVSADGQTPMTGALNMATNNISNVGTLNALNNVGVGTLSSWNVYNATQTQNMTMASTASGDNRIVNNAYFNTGVWYYQSTRPAGYESLNSDATGAIFTWNRANSGTAGTAITWSESMRIEGSGSLLVNTTALYAGLSGKLQSASATSYWALSLKDSASNGSMVAFVNPSGVSAGSITISGTTTTYGTSSDYRLKENVQPMTGALDVVSKLKPCTYNWIADKSKGQGFIAHELQEVVPNCIVGEKDAVDINGNPKYQQLDTSFLVATLTAAIQELKAELDSVKAELAALKA
jgi:hypothetical protein